MLTTIELSFLFCVITDDSHFHSFATTSKLAANEVSQPQTTKHVCNLGSFDLSGAVNSRRESREIETSNLAGGVCILECLCFYHKTFRLGKSVATRVVDPLPSNYGMHSELARGPQCLQVVVAGGGA